MEKRHLCIKSICIWLPFAALATVLCGLAYFLVQQDIRTSANYPQADIAHRVASALTLGATPSEAITDAGIPLTVPSVTGLSSVDMQYDLDPYVIIFSATGTPIQSTGTLDGLTPTPPHGVFTQPGIQKYSYGYVNDDSRFTWEPSPGIRSAAVLTGWFAESYNDDPDNSPVPPNGFVLVGRSLREVEILESRLMYDAFSAWLVALVVTLFFSVILAKVLSGEKGKKSEGPGHEPPPTPAANPEIRS